MLAAMARARLLNSECAVKPLSIILKKKKKKETIIAGKHQLQESNNCVRNMREQQKNEIYWFTFSAEAHSHYEQVKKLN